MATINRLALSMMIVVSGAENGIVDRTRCDRGLDGGCSVETAAAGHSYVQIRSNDNPCQCDQVHPLLLEQKKKQTWTVPDQYNPQGPACEQHCQSHGCPCIVPWSERCYLETCAGCPECHGGSHPPLVPPYHGSPQLGKYPVGPYEVKNIQDLMSCEGTPINTTQCFTEGQYRDLRQKVCDSLDKLGKSEDKADWVGCIVRLSAHDCMDFDPQTGGGCDGCIDMNHPDNRGLRECVEGNFKGADLPKIYSEFCTKISMADFLVFAASAAMECSKQPRGKLFDELKFGRITRTHCTFFDNSLPNPEQGCDANKEHLFDKMGLDWKQITAVMGLHTLGRAEKHNLGYEGWWSDIENSAEMNNNYFVSMVAKGWGPTKNSRTKTQWVRIDDGAKSNQHTEMMLNSDICLAFTHRNEPLNAHGHMCCAWFDPQDFNINNEWCGRTKDDFKAMSSQDQQKACCGRVTPGCDNPKQLHGLGARFVLEFAGDEKKWFEALAEAWQGPFTSVGHKDLKPLTQSC